MCVTGTDHPPPLPPWNVDDVTRAISKEGGACECPRVGVFFNCSEGVTRTMSKKEGGGVLVNVFTPPPPSGNPVSAPVQRYGQGQTKMAHSLTTIGLHLECAIQTEMVVELGLALDNGN